MSIYENVMALCNQNGITKTALEETCGFSQNSLNKWKASSPSIKNLIKVADHFGVSVDCLLGRAELPIKKAVPMERPNSDIANMNNRALSDKFVEDYQDLIQEKCYNDITKLYEKLEEAARKSVLLYIIRYYNEKGIDTFPIVGYRLGD